MEVLLSRTVPQILGLTEIVNKTGGFVQASSPIDAKTGILAGDLEESTKSWKGRSIGRAIKFGAELTDRFNTRFAILNESLSACHATLEDLWVNSYQADLLEEMPVKLQLERRRDWVGKETAWSLLDFISSMLVSYRDLDVCFQDPGKEECRGKMVELVAFLDDELIPFLRTIYGVAWSQGLPYRHRQWRDTFTGWFMYSMTSIIDFDATGVGLAYRQLEIAIFRLQRHADSLRKYQREDPTHLAERFKKMQHTGAKALKQGSRSSSCTRSTWTGSCGSCGSTPRRGPGSSSSPPESIASIQLALTESAEKLISWQMAKLKKHGVK
ncbi:hypothetical protein PG994_008244 [Apiospora phragmitis]|uniref:Uncharacterized protein n=1 Tax=Apiospora phragmitis TaxID=2905665 RepID=A0ABR1UVK9_9PEZI